MEDRYIMCGDIIPEGIQVCRTCEEKVNNMNKEGYRDDTAEQAIWGARKEERIRFLEEKHGVYRGEKAGKEIQGVIPVELTKDILVQYCEIKEEIKDLRERIDRDEQRLQRIKEEGVVSDMVTGTRKDGTIGAIKITGFPTPEYDQVRLMIKKRIMKLHIMEDELQEAMNAVDDFINAIPKSDLRQMFRFYYIDDMAWRRVATNMNKRFPNRRISYTEESCRKRHDRFLEKNEII